MRRFESFAYIGELQNIKNYKYHNVRGAGKCVIDVYQSDVATRR